MGFELRRATDRDQALIARALFAAWQWRHPWDEAAFELHVAAGSPDSYVDDFGLCTGDAGMIAEEVIGTERRFAGAAWYRFFASAERRSGFVAEDVPELVVAVEAEARGRGIGRQLLQGLIDLARQQQVRPLSLSLHVSNENTVAAALYRSLGFEDLHNHQGRGTVMIKQL